MRGKANFFLNGVKRRVALSLPEFRGGEVMVVMMITTTVIATDGYPHHLHLENHSSLCSAICMTGVLTAKIIQKEIKNKKNNHNKKIIHI
jgi:hypothetical protein